ncbi:hypothetical protein Micbo1qcDRAFT_190674 [Microdochium bolleyi]|uniref:DUF1750-domain-containing protein n=1 Tax=Microdochium bolleyi TaxID=196109 RepID=A0A136IN94_9PEZI|nr:hypothetical protein Micbo1qcDRAFT_190674 [Microdochium bolleyi]
MSQMADPSFGVNRDLLPHVHLVSTYRYPVKATIQPNEVTSLLIQAPKIARDTAPFYWTYLDKPENGSIFLTWQPLQQMNVQFASDGYVWPPQETYYQQEVGNGVILEMYLQKTGFAFGEQYAMHSRRRFRLIPPNVPNPNAPQVDPSLWIVHYGPNEPNDRIHASQLPRDARTQQIHETRSYLHRCGQIQRKEFILGDRPNWPQIGWPREAQRQPVYAGNRVPQSMAYPSQPPSASGPPSKRARTSQAAHAQGAPPMGALAHQDSAYDDDEDTSRGDMFDHLTPREISLHRYRQNHEWMEEILSSPYSMGQIGFADIGLGLKGELSGLTEGIFDPQDYKTLLQPSTAAPKTRLEPEQAEEFRKRVNDRISATNSEIEKIKAEHEMKLRKFKKNSVLTASEKKLRQAIDDASRDGFNLEGRPDESADGSGRWHAKSSETVDQIIANVESQLGRHAEAVIELRRIQEGGYQEPAPEPIPEPEPEPVATASIEAPAGAAAGANGSSGMSPQPSQAGSNHSGIMIGDSDIDMGGTAAGLLDQMYTGMSSTSTPNNNFPTPQAHLSAAQSHAATPVHVASPQAQSQQASHMENADIKMGDTETAKSHEAPGGSLPDGGSGSGDWVVVPKDGVTPGSSNSVGVGAGMAYDGGSDPSKAAPATNTSSKQASAVGTPAGASTTNDFVDFGSLGDLDTAGDALAGYGDTPGDLGADLDLGTEMDM